MGIVCFLEIMVIAFFVIGGFKVTMEKGKCRVINWGPKLSLVVTFILFCNGNINVNRSLSNTAPLS